MLEILAFAYPAVIVGTITYGILERAGFAQQNLKLLRAERNWSQADLAQKLGVSRQTVNAIETEKYDPSLPLAFKMARLFGRAIEDIFSV
jgi:putative transcriptional regulator